MFLLSNHFWVFHFMSRMHGGEYAPLQPPEIRLSSVAFGDSLEAFSNCGGGRVKGMQE
jgi:hypothetical protein